MGIEVLVSTMDNNLSLVDKMNIKTNCLIVNQNEKEFNDIKHIESGSKNIKFINTNTKGLSKSRNIALKYADAEICILADDDLIYVDNFESIIRSEFENNKAYDLIAFQVEGIDKKFKKYKEKECNIDYLKSMKIASVEIAFRLASIKKNNINFDELLGSGSEFFMGEENAFLFRCLDAGLRIKYVPIKIANLYVGNSSWFKGYNEEYFISRGASFTAMSFKMSILLIFQFAIRKYKLYKNDMNLYNAIVSMIKGRKRYLNICKRNKNDENISSR